MASIEIYTSPFCGFCFRAKHLLEKKGVAFDEIDVMMDAGKRQEMMQRGGGHTVPQIFIGGEPIGGCEELFELDFDGALDARLGIADDG
jgi:glutaredoxin 3